MRQPGYYWCKYKDEWIIAEYWQIRNSGGWSMMEEENILFTDSDFEEIDERRIERTTVVDKNPEWT